MSYPLTRLVALTAHPVVRRIGNTRAVLGVLAERAGKKDGTGSFPGVGSIAGATGIDRRDVNRLLRALEEAGLITSDGTSDHETAVRQINVPALAAWVDGKQFGNRDKLPGWGAGGGDVAPVRMRKRARGGVGQNPMGGSGVEPHGVGMGSSPMGGVGQNPMGGSGVEPHAKHTSEPRHESLLLLSVGDLQIDTSTQRAHVGGAGGAHGEEQVENEPTAQNTATPPKPATLKRDRSPKVEPAHVQECIEAILPDVVALHGREHGTPPSRQAEAGIRSRIATRLKDRGVDETAVRARAAGLAAVLRWWALPPRDAAARGEPFCWWTAAITVNALLPVHADLLDQRIGFAQAAFAQFERAKSMNTNRNSGSTGVYRQPDHYVDATGMNDRKTWHPTEEELLASLGPDPKGGG